jgi:hypothetical protein
MNQAFHGRWSGIFSFNCPWRMRGAETNYDSRLYYPMCKIAYFIYYVCAVATPRAPSALQTAALAWILVAKKTTYNIPLSALSNCYTIRRHYCIKRLCIINVGIGAILGGCIAHSILLYDEFEHFELPWRESLPCTIFLHSLKLRYLQHNNSWVSFSFWYQTRSSWQALRTR